MRRRARPGDYLVVDDRTGFVIWASDARKEWTGALVHRDVWEARHPQDFVRGRRDNSRVPDPRPRPTDTYAGPLITEMGADASAGDVAVSFLHTERMLAGDSIVIMLDNGDAHRNIIQVVDSVTDVRLDTPLPSAVSSGNRVINYTAVSPAVTE